MERSFKTHLASIILAGAVGLVGCSNGAAPKQSAKLQGHEKGHAQAPAGTDDQADAEIASERAKLSTEDRALVDAQEWCVVLNDQRLGSMGPSIKLVIQGQSVFICCKGCQKKANADPAKTLAKVEELKTKKKKQSAQP